MENMKELAILKNLVKILKDPRIYALIIAAVLLLPTLMFVGCDTGINQESSIQSSDGSESGNKTEQNNSNNNNNSNSNTSNSENQYKNRSEILKTILYSDYYNGLIHKAKNSAANKNFDYETQNKYQAIPYGFLEDEGFDIDAIKEDRLKCETEVFLLDGELYLTCRVENKASTDYYTHFVIKYNLTEKELNDLNLLHKEYDEGSNQARSVCFQAPFFIQQLFLDKEATKLSENNITKDAEKMAEKHIGNKMENNKYIDLSDFSTHISATYVKEFTEEDNIATSQTYLFFNDAFTSSPVVQTKKISQITVTCIKTQITNVNGEQVYTGVVPTLILIPYEHVVGDNLKTATFYNTYNSSFFDMLDPKFQNFYGLE